MYGSWSVIGRLCANTGSGRCQWIEDLEWQEFAFFLANVSFTNSNIHLKSAIKSDTKPRLWPLVFLLLFRGLLISSCLLFFVKPQTGVKHTLYCPSLQQLVALLTRRGKKMHSHLNQTQKWMVQCPRLQLYPSLIWLLRLGIDICLSSFPPPAASKPLVSFRRWIKTQTAAAPWWAPPAAASGSAVHAAAGFTLPSFPSFVFTGVPAAWWRHSLQGAASGRRHATAPAECGISRDANKRQIPYAASPTTGDPF